MTAEDREWNDLIAQAQRMDAHDNRVPTPTDAANHVQVVASVPSYTARVGKLYWLDLVRDRARVQLPSGSCFTCAASELRVVE